MDELKLDENSSVPLYAQMRDVLRRQIEEGRFRPGERIPSEEKLNGMFGVSRITIRRALKELVDAGYLTKRSGKGTYVNERLPGTAAPSKVAAKFSQNNDVQSFTEACEANGQVAGARLISCRVVAGLDAERAFFGFGAEGRLLCVERVRTADGVPIMVEENYFPYPAYKFLETADFANTSLFDAIRTGGHGEPELTEPCALDIELAGASLAPVLEVEVGEPLFCLFGRYYDQSGQAMYLGKQHIVGSRYTFRI